MIIALQTMFATILLSVIIILLLIILVLIVNLWMVKIDSKLIICNYFDHHNQLLLSHDDKLGHFWRADVGDLWCRKQKHSNNNRPRDMSEKVIVWCFTLDSNMLSCFHNNFGDRQVGLMLVGVRTSWWAPFPPPPHPSSCSRSPPVPNSNWGPWFGALLSNTWTFSPLDAILRLMNLHSRISFQVLE